jgi:predicted nucleic acid-binding protein
MPAEALIDTGAILALLDRSDRWHGACVRAFAQLRLPLFTSEAVLTELFHLVGDARVQMEAAWKFVRSGALYLARRESLSTIFTVDHADFATYRIEGKRQFRVLPVTRP